MIPLLSIVVPIKDMNDKLQNLTYWLDTALDSDFEVILVEDICDIRLAKDLERKAREKTNLKIISGYFGNPGSARNAGKELASGIWIAFWDADDKGNPSRIREALVNVSKSAEMVVFSNETIDWNTGGLKEENHVIPMKQDIIQVANKPGIWRMVFRSEFIKCINFPSFRMGEDQVFLATVIQEQPQIVFIDEIVYSYFVNVPSQLTSSEDAINDLILAASKMKALCADAKQPTFIYELLIRQYVSGLRHGQLKLKVRFAYELSAFMLSAAKREKIHILNKVLSK
jgi:glycosyltransferase involved in cell wall biosynthesis